MSFFPSYSPPPPPPSFLTAEDGGMSGTTSQSYNAESYNDSTSSSSSSSSSPSSSFTSSIVITSIVISSAIIISASIYILLRFLSRRSPRDDVALQNRIDTSSSSSFSSRAHTESAFTALDSLPLFTFGSVNGNLTGRDCAVCLSKFEKEDQLRLLPLCCHAFHAHCIDAWLLSNQTCPLCRSTVYPTDADVMNKVLSVTENVNSNNNISNSIENNNSSSGSSFRIEIGSISRRMRGVSNAGERSYSLGSFEYIVDDGYEIPLESIHRRGVSDVPDVDKESSGGGGGGDVEAPPGERLETEVGGSGRNWLREYVDRLTSRSISSRAMSFRSSGRFFSGSSRRNDVVVPVVEDLEANTNNRAGEDISELFRWISGV